MDNRIHVERLKEQYNILANLIANIPTELGETNVNIVTGYDTFEDQTIFELSRFIFVGEGNNPMESALCNLRCILKDLLADNDIRNCALRTEIRRFLCLIDCLIRVLRNIDFNNNSRRLLGVLLCLLFRVILILLSLIAKLIILLLVCRDCDIRCNNVRFGFCRCLLDEFARELEDLSRVLYNLENLAMELRRCRPCNCNRQCNCNRPCNFDRPW